MSGVFITQIKIQSGSFHYPPLFISVSDKGSETNSPAELSTPSSQGGLLASSLPGSSSSIDREDEESRILKQVQ